MSVFVFVFVYVFVFVFVFAQQVYSVVYAPLVLLEFLVVCWGLPITSRGLLFFSFTIIIIIIVIKR